MQNIKVGKKKLKQAFTEVNDNLIRKYSWNHMFKIICTYEKENNACSASSYILLNSAMLY